MKDLKRMPDKKPPVAKKKIPPKLSQKERFLEYAKEIEVDENEVERAFDKVIPKPPPK